MDTPLLDHCPPTLPREAYVDPAWFAREMRAIWSRDWVCAGRTDQFPAGTIRRIAVAGQSIIVLHDGASLRAFQNVCRHRGSELCATDTAQRGKLITCPYHAWSYATDGRLVSTACATPTPDFRKEDHSLLPVAATEWNGFLFLSLSTNPGPLEPDMGLDALAHWPMTTLKTGHVLEKTLACNWKVYWENYSECLHCPGIHPELCDMVPIYSKGIMSPAEDATSDGTPKAPLKPGAESWTMTGEPSAPAFATLTPQERAEGFRFVTLWPTMYIVAHVDYVRAVTLTPINPEETLLRAEWLFPPETLARPGFDHRTVTDFATIVMEQDGAACEMNQRGLRSPAYTRGTLMPQEFDIARLHGWVKDRLSTGAQP
ncbi:MAG: aromatic ring-hydroxylating dioxygenase subunit alpha [Rhodobacterales bacterium]|nr:aromatic ring-hydroxylating dioxygenase subunit alpha [Rhodobacterales bacterium]